MTARRRLPALVSLALVAPLLTACQLLGGGSSLDDALEVVPGDATQITFVDRAASAERLGVDDLETGADDGELEDYYEALAKDPVGGTPLSQFVAPMQEAAFSEFDVAWWVQAAAEDGPPINVYKVEDVDLDELVGDLEDAGFASEESGGRTMLTVESPTDVTDDTGLIDGRYPLEFGFGVLVDPDEDLVATGADLDRVVDVLEDDEDSLTDAGTFDDLADGVDDVELAYLAEDPPCGGDRSSEEAIEALGHRRARHAVRARLLRARRRRRRRGLGPAAQFDDDDAAEADLDARKDYVENGQSARTGQPVSDLGSADLEQDGAVVAMELDLENPATGRRIAFESDAFFACAP